MVAKNMQKASQSRVFTIEDRAGPANTPRYQSLGRLTGVTWALGDITPVRVADPKKYGNFIVVDQIRGQQGLPATTLEVRMTRGRSDLLDLIRKGCPIDIHAHIGACKDPSDFDLGWEKVLVLEEANFTNYSTGELGAFDANQEQDVMETYAVTASDYYQILPLTFAQIGETQIIQEIADVAICDSRACGACGIPSDGVQKVFAVSKTVGASPGLLAKLIYTQNGGSTLGTSTITSLPANRNTSAVGCVGPYLVVLSNDDCAYHYALITDVLAGTATFTRLATGLTCAAGAPNDIYSVDRTNTWVVGNGGYIYKMTDPTVGVTAQTSGDVTAQNLNAIHGIDELNIVAVGGNSAILLTRNGGTTWSLVTGPSGQSAVAINTVSMVSANVWFIGFADGKLYYTVDAGVNWTQISLPSQSTLTAVDDIVFATQTVGYLTARTSSAARIMRTINGGRTWYVLPEQAGLSIPTSSQLTAIAASGDNPNVVWAGGLEVAAGDGVLIKGS